MYVDATSFILELWRFLSISSLQEQHNIPNVSRLLISKVNFCNQFVEEISVYLYLHTVL